MMKLCHWWMFGGGITTQLQHHAVQKGFTLCKLWSLPRLKMHSSLILDVDPPNSQSWNSCFLTPCWSSWGNFLVSSPSASNCLDFSWLLGIDPLWVKSVTLSYWEEWRLGTAFKPYWFFGNKFIANYIITCIYLNMYFNNSKSINIS